MKVGIVVAIELSALQDKYGEAKEVIKHHGYDVLMYEVNDKQLYVVSCGAGEIASASATQLLISAFDVEMIFNFGVVGGLTKEMSLCKLCVVRSVVHYEFDTSAYDGCEVGRHIEYPNIEIYTNELLRSKAKEIIPDLKEVVCASGNKFVDLASEKIMLHENFGCDICEMEAAGIVLTCDKNNIPCLLLKMVSDSVEGGASEFGKELARTSKLCFDALDNIIKDL